MEDTIKNNIDPDNDIKDKKSFISKKLIYITLVIIIIILFIFLLIIRSNINKNDAIFTVDGTSYSSTTVSNIISYPLQRKLGTRNTLTRQVYNYLISEDAAKNLGFNPTNKEVENEANVVFGNSTTFTKLADKLTWVRLVSYDNLLKEKINTNSFSQYSGYSYIFWFGQHLETGAAGTVPNYGNKSLISEDKSYAYSKANYYYGQLKYNKSSPEEVLKDVQKDPKLNYSLPNNQFLSQSTQFGVNNTYWQQQVIYPDIIDYIYSQSSTGLSNIRTGKISIANQPKSAKDYVDGFYYVVDLTKAIKANNITQQELSNSIKKVNASYNGW